MKKVIESLIFNNIAHKFSTYSNIQSYKDYFPWTYYIYLIILIFHHTTTTTTFLIYINIVLV